MPDEKLKRLAFDILPAVRMRLRQDKPVVMRLSRGEEIPEASRILSLDWTGTAGEDVVALIAASMKEEQGLLMLKDAGVLAWAPEITLVEALLAGKTPEAKEPADGPLTGRTALITGAAQGFGKGLAEHLAADGACVMVADINEQTGRETVRELQEKTGNAAIAFVKADVTDAASVENMVQETVLTFGGLDLFISNAGVLKAGGLDQLEEEAFDFVTRVNYKGFYLGTKYASRVMKTQHAYASDPFMDIIQINSKSGLQGSNRNFAYAGSKFGSIGLVQSFALELVTDNIKVNAVCPGNFFDGPLWSDPDNGLFVQYLRAGKVAGAKSIADVRRHYERLVPMGRGTTVEDVYKAVRYLIDQEYETGQALPVTGGQVMLK